jgi:sec-independent protein translocase protein TatA
MTATFALFSLSPMEIVILLGIGVLLFGSKLPAVGRSIGQAFSELKKGMSGVEDEVMGSIHTPPRYTPPSLEMPRPPQRVPGAAPKFEDSSITITPPTTA